MEWRKCLSLECCFFLLTLTAEVKAFTWTLSLMILSKTFSLFVGAAASVGLDLEKVMYNLPYFNLVECLAKTFSTYLFVKWSNYVEFVKPIGSVALTQCGLVASVVISFSALLANYMHLRAKLQSLKHKHKL